MKDRLEELQRNIGETSFGSSIRKSFRASHRTLTKGSRIHDFLRKANALRININDLKVLIEKVKKCHSDILTAVTNQDKHKEQLEQLNLEIRRIESTVRAGLRDIDPSGKEDLETCSNAELRIRKTQLESLTQDLVKVMHDFQAEQALYNDKCMGQIARRMKIKNPDIEIDDKEIERIIESGEQTSLFTDDILLSINDAKATLSDLKNREKELNELEKKIVMVNEIFRDLNLLVAEQGEVIDSIEDNVESAAVNVQEGTKQIQQASKYKDKWRKKKFICIGIVVVVVIVIVAIILGTVL